MANPYPVVSTPKMLKSEPQFGSKSDDLLSGEVISRGCPIN